MEGYGVYGGCALFGRSKTVRLPNTRVTAFKNRKLMVFQGTMIRKGWNIPQSLSHTVVESHFRCSRKRCHSTWSTLHIGPTLAPWWLRTSHHVTLEDGVREAQHGEWDEAVWPIIGRNARRSIFKTHQFLTGRFLSNKANWRKTPSLAGCGTSLCQSTLRKCSFGGIFQSLNGWATCTRQPGAY